MGSARVAVSSTIGRGGRSNQTLRISWQPYVVDASKPTTIEKTLFSKMRALAWAAAVSQTSAIASADKLKYSMCSWNSFEMILKMLIVRMLGLAKGIFLPQPRGTAAKTVKGDDVKPAISIAIAPRGRH